MSDLKKHPRRKNRKRSKPRREVLPPVASRLPIPDPIPVPVPVPAPIPTIHRTQANHEGVVFVWFDPAAHSSLNIPGALRAVNDNVQSFHDPSACLTMIQSSTEKIFFVSTSTNTDFLTEIHQVKLVEFIFIFSISGESIKGDFPKLVGVFYQQEEFFRALKEVVDAFEQIQLESFEFEHDRGFLWSQLWKETTNQTPRKKDIFTDSARQYYRDNPMVLRLIDDFEKSYRPTEVVSWCLRSPFPSRFLLHALRSHNKEQLNICRPIFIDVAYYFHQLPKTKITQQFYRGMKLSDATLNKFEAHINRLVSPIGFFPCTKSRGNALSLASLPVYRPDLLPVLFKINCDSASLYVEITERYPSPVIAFDVNTAFFVIYVKRGPMTVIKMKATPEFGQKVALEYREQHQDQPIQTLIDQLARPPTPPPKPRTPPPKQPTPPPPKPPTPPPPEPPVPDQATTGEKQSQAWEPTTEEILAESCVRRGEIDRALSIYERIEPMTARVLNTIALLSSEKKGDYQHAIKCYTQALEMLDENSDECVETLSDLGNAYQNCEGYDLALGNHTRALALRESRPTADNAAIASNHIGIANAHWARYEYTEAIDHTQRALLLRENLNPTNEASVAATYAMLSNMYQDSGNSSLAVELSKKALTIFERVLSNDSPILAELFYNLANMQLHINSIEDACRSYEKAVKTYRKFLPQDHPDRVSAENEYRRVYQLYQANQTQEQK